MGDIYTKHHSEWYFIKSHSPGDTDLASGFEEATRAIQNAPYDFRAYVLRGNHLQNKGHHEIGAGDIYKALLLLDEFLDESGEYHEQVCETEKTHHENIDSDDYTMLVRIRAHLICCRLAEFLAGCGCYRSAYDFCQRSLRYGPLDPVDAIRVEDQSFDYLKTVTLSFRNGDQMDQSSSTKSPGLSRKELFHPSNIPENGIAAREVYPWNVHEPDRYSDSNLAELNEKLSHVSTKLAARITELPLLVPEASNPNLSDASEQGLSRQFGLFAKEDISAGEEILSENSVLTANKYLHGELCDACSGSLPPVGEPSFACPECDEAAFCSQRCLDTALSTYHPAVCDTDANTVARDSSPKEAADSLYFLLLSRSLAMSEYQDVNPLDLWEVKYLWGDFGPAASIPFSFKWNIEYPFHFLEKMNVNIFETVDRYDVWIFNTLYAKFRGVASGRVNARDGVPEVSAVHPLWCLANHSCAPNVKWEWGGNIRFWARTEDELVCWGPPESQNAVKGAPGIRKDDEIFSHYGDISLDVKERQEWMRGALGGDCRCERCQWEKSQAANKEGSGT